MRRSFPITLAILTLALAQSAEAQIKQPQAKNPKDEGLHYVVLREFSKVSAKLDQLAEKVAALEGELARIKQQNADATVEIRAIQTSIKTTDTTFSNFRLSNEQSLLNIKSELVQLRTDLATLSDLVKRSQIAAVPPAGAETSTGSTLEGYIMEVGEREVKVSLGAGHGIRAGARLAVFAAADPKTQIGQLVVTEVLDANNSRAEIIIKSPGATFNFSDIVRPIS